MSQQFLMFIEMILRFLIPHMLTMLKAVRTR